MLRLQGIDLSLSLSLSLFSVFPSLFPVVLGRPKRYLVQIDPVLIPSPARTSSAAILQRHRRTRVAQQRVREKYVRST